MISARTEPAKANASYGIDLQVVAALAEPYRVDGDPVNHYEVTVELPRQTVEVYAKNPAEAEWRAWQMIGEAGVKGYGELKAEPVAPPAPPAVTHTGQK